MRQCARLEQRSAFLLPSSATEARNPPSKPAAAASQGPTAAESKSRAARPVSVRVYVCVCLCGCVPTPPPSRSADVLFPVHEKSAHRLGRGECTQRPLSFASDAAAPHSAPSTHTHMHACARISCARRPMPAHLLADVLRVSKRRACVGGLQRQPLGRSACSAHAHRHGPSLRSRTACPTHAPGGKGRVWQWCGEVGYEGGVRERARRVLACSHLAPLDVCLKLIDPDGLSARCACPSPPPQRASASVLASVFEASRHLSISPVSVSSSACVQGYGKRVSRALSIIFPATNLLLIQQPAFLGSHALFPSSLASSLLLACFLLWLTRTAL